MYMNSESYALAWFAYAAGGMGLFAFWCWMTSGLSSRMTKLTLRSLMFVMIMFPFNIGGGYAELAPGFLMMLLETIFEGGDAFFRVGTPLMMALAATFIVLVLIELVAQHLRRKTAVHVALNVEHDELLDQSLAQHSASGDQRREPSL